MHTNYLDLMTLIAKLTCEPARIIGSRYGELGTLKAGNKADITILDPNKEWIVNSHDFASKGRNTAYDGHQFKGKVMATIVNGELIYRDNSVRLKNSITPGKSN